MTRGFSLYLDAARVLAAVLVLVSHLAVAQASGPHLAWLRGLNVGSDAVIIFFVLSGLVIAHTAHDKDRTLAGYAFARLTRLWSVALPAIVLSVVLVIVGWSTAPSFYGSLDAFDLVARALRSITFSNYLWDAGAHLPANNPYWSVTYEFWYYAGFGAAAFLTGRARLYALAAVALVAGPRILLLAPCWIAGVWVRHALHAGWASRLDAKAGVVLAAAPLVAYAALQAAAVPDLLTRLTSLGLGGADPNAVLGFSDEFLWNWLLAALTAANFIGVARLFAANRVLSAPIALAAPIRWAAARTFSLYLFHMPILQFVVASPGYDPNRSGHLLALTGTLLAAPVLLAELTERRLGGARRLLVNAGEAATPRLARAVTVLKVRLALRRASRPC